MLSSSGSSNPRMAQPKMKNLPSAETSVTYQSKLRHILQGFSVKSALRNSFSSCASRVYLPHTNVMHFQIQVFQKVSLCRWGFVGLQCLHLHDQLVRQVEGIATFRNVGSYESAQHNIPEDLIFSHTAVRISNLTYLYYSFFYISSAQLTRNVSSQNMFISGNKSDNNPRLLLIYHKAIISSSNPHNALP